MNLREIGPHVAQRRIDLGLSQERLAKLGGLSRSTIVHLENGRLKELGATKLFALLGLLGLDLSMRECKKLPHALEAISTSASVSYKKLLNRADLVHSLATGKLSDVVLPYIATILDEAPLPMIVLAVEEVAKASKIPPKAIWKHIDRWAQELQSPRGVWH